MRLIRFIHEQMTKPTSAVESINEQSAHEMCVEQENAEEKECVTVQTATTSGAI